MVTNSDPDRGTFPPGAILALVGSIAATISAVVTWWSAGSQTTAGTGLDGGRVVLLLGVFSFVLALVWILRLDRPLPPFHLSGSVIGSLEGLITVAGLIILVTVLLNYGDASKASIAPGFWLALFAGAAMTVGGILGFLTEKAKV